jgi:hypothetical protein
MSSKRLQRRKSCERKRQYATQADAVAAILSGKRKGLHGLHRYKCSFGNHWHVGHRKSEH